MKKSKEKHCEDKFELAYCGINCAKCDILLQGKCVGCRNSAEVECARNCKILPCARSRGQTYCFQCEDFPCENVEAFASGNQSQAINESHAIIVRNMTRMREIGLDGWFTEHPEAKDMLKPLTEKGL